MAQTSDHSTSSRVIRTIGVIGRASACAILVVAIISQNGCVRSDATKDRTRQYTSTQSQVDVASLYNDAYVIRKGDDVQITVWGYSEFNTTTSVRENGVIGLPLVGEVKAEGLTVEQLKQRLLALLAEYVQGDVRLTVTVGSAVGQKITVLGAVVRQENYPVKTELTLLEVLSTAGGTTPESDLRRIRIFPGGSNVQPIEVDLSWYMENGNIHSLPLVRPGDTVFVPKRENVVREVADFARDIVFLFGFFRLFQ
jgi:polysaccharide export outer membrane protein